MRWEEFKTNIDTLSKYITYVKKKYQNPCSYSRSI